MEFVYCHKKDKTKRTGYDGAYAQDLFVSSVRKMGFNVYNTSLSENKYLHKDYIIEQNGLKISTDVKYPKRISRYDTKPSSEWLWVEFVGTKGYPGWLYGKEDTISFLMPDFKNFMMVNRNELKDLCEKICSNEFVSNTTEAYYKRYTRTRTGEQDVISLIRYDDIKNNCNYVMIPVSK